MCFQFAFSPLIICTLYLSVYYGEKGPLEWFRPGLEQYTKVKASWLDTDAKLGDPIGFSSTFPIPQLRDQPQKIKQ